MAYAYRALAGGGFNVLRENMVKAVSLKDKVSPGERHWILAQEARFDGNLPAAKQHWQLALKIYEQIGVPNAGRVRKLLEENKE